MVVRAGPVSVLLLAAAPFLIQIPLTAADTRTAPPRTPGSRAPGTAPSRGYSICINGLGSRCCSGLIVMQIKHSSAENPPNSICPPAPDHDQEGTGPGSVCPGAVTMMDAELCLQSPAQLQSEVTQFLETGITVNEGGVVS